MQRPIKVEDLMIVNEELRDQVWNWRFNTANNFDI